jgi:pimeloyl-ACP methyl ester carboxylesterase
MNNKDRKIILILHGFPGLSHNDALHGCLKKMDCDIVIPDLFDSAFHFDTSEIQKYIESKLQGRKPDAILAFSMGGLIAPFIATKYPQAKLILIATGPRIDLAIKPFNFLVKNLNIDYLKWVYKGFNHVPFNLYRALYEIFNPYKGESDRKNRYYQDIEDMYQLLKKHDLEKLKEILQFVRITDTSEILEKLSNETLIIAGGHDVLMPHKLSLEIKEHVKKSRLIENSDRLHFEVFDERDFATVNDFIKDVVRN